ncbi:MAG: precorrin-2 C(20)-methyltransferase [Alphaproteobacteria bacterium]|nr:precorrin-2 C(20)-methyltransferase [Alphaproteobacteria bacterium]
MNGELYLIGVGPGDPELLTLKAKRILAAADVVAFPQKPGEEPLAYAIAAGHIAAEAERLPLDLPIAVDRAPAQKAYDEAAALIEDRLASGLNVAYLCAGDPLFYGSAMYLLDRLKPLVGVHVVPGVTSVSASAAAIARPLAARNEIFKVLPAPLEDEVLERELHGAQSVAIIKTGRHLPRIRLLLEKSGLLASALVVTRASHGDETVTPLEAVTGDVLPYFSTILAYGGAEAWAETLAPDRRFAPSPAQPPEPTIALDPERKPAIILFTTAGAATASRIATATGGRVHAFGPGEEGAADLLPRLFAEGTPIVGVAAAGILIRLLAASLADKRAEPPVVAVSADGGHVVPLLGGHHGGNALARQLAETLGGVAAVTTASDTRFTRGLDEPPPGFVLENPAEAKQAMARVLNGEQVSIVGEAPWLAEAGYPVSDTGSVEVRVTPRADAEADLVYRPKTLVAGVGCERGVTPDEIYGLLASTLSDKGLSPESLAAIASIDIKADEPALNRVAERFGVPLRLFSAAELAEEEARLVTPSEVVRAETGTPGVAEAAALKAGTLLVPKRRSARATCAIGLAAAPIEIAEFGRARGMLHIVGIGPGDAAQRTGSAVRALSVSTDWVGYGLYLDLVADLQGRRKTHRFPLGDEEVRVRHALELAGKGRTVALVSSGDAQIYAMASLVYELLDATGERALSDAARRIAVACHPGISAMQMASARAGALIGHDFCAISLSDLLTPAADIRRRLATAALGDFVTALYNPRSGRRTELIEIAKGFFLAHRRPDTPVIVATNLGRDGERVRVTNLKDFDPQSVDMLTIVLIGSSQSRILRRGDGTVAFTPRGYDRKTEKGEA